MGVALALEHAHSQGVLHRDVKAENIYDFNEPGRESSPIWSGVVRMTTRAHHVGRPLPSARLITSRRTGARAAQMDHAPFYSSAATLVTGWGRTVALRRMRSWRVMAAKYEAPCLRTGRPIATTSNPAVSNDHGRDVSN